MKRACIHSNIDNSLSSKIDNVTMTLIIWFPQLTTADREQFQQKSLQQQIEMIFSVWQLRTHSLHQTGWASWRQRMENNFNLTQVCLKRTTTRMIRGKIISDSMIAKKKCKDQTVGTNLRVTDGLWLKAIHRDCSLVQSFNPLRKILHWHKWI